QQQSPGGVGEAQGQRRGIERAVPSGGRFLAVDGESRQRRQRRQPEGEREGEFPDHDPAYPCALQVCVVEAELGVKVSAVLAATTSGTGNEAVKPPPAGFIMVRPLPSLSAIVLAAAPLLPHWIEVT